MIERIDHGREVAAEHGVGPRSPHWRGVEESYLAENPVCIACDPDAPIEHIGCQVHHTDVPYHIAILLGLPYLELDKRNLSTFGETEEGKPAPNHHCEIAHGGNFRLYNGNARADAIVFRGMSTDQIKADPRWIAIHADRVSVQSRSYDEWTDAEKIATRLDLMTRLPFEGFDAANGVGAAERFGLKAPEPMETWKP